MSINPKEHVALQQYRDTMVRLIKSAFPQVPIEIIRRGIDYSISKRFKNFNLVVQNNYTQNALKLSVIEMLDYIAKRKPIVTSYGTMFKQISDTPNPMAKVIQKFLDLRKTHKKEMFKYPKGSEIYERYNLLQQLDKIDANGIYGLTGLYTSFIYDRNVSPAVTSTGRSLISSAILCFEGFLGNNVQFGSLNEILTFIDNVRREYTQWEYNDWDILDYKGFASLEECFTKLILNCGYKYVPSEQDMDIVWNIVRNCNAIELNRLFYKNNLYNFMDQPIARNLMTRIITGMTRPYINPADPPEEILADLNYLRDLLVEYVFYCHQYIDRVVRNKEMIKKISLVSDTDSSFVSLDAWYNYNIQYLSRYDCPILHQSITQVEETSTGANQEYDAYNEATIEKVDNAQPLTTPNDNMKYAIINVMAYILSTVINLYMIDFTKQSGSYKSDKACRINMKNEFYMSRIMLTGVKKCYASMQILQEGNYLEGGNLSTTGIACLKKSSTAKATQDALKKILVNDILLPKEVDQFKLIQDIAALENTIYNDLRSGSKKYYKPVIIKSIGNYQMPDRIQGIKAAMAWNHVKGDLPGFNLDERNAMDIVKVVVNKYLLDQIKELYPYQWERFSELISLDTPELSTLFKGELNFVGVPKNVPVPEWLKPFIDYQTVITDNLSGFPLSSVGICQFGAKKANYSNVIRL